MVEHFYVKFGRLFLAAAVFTARRCASMV